MISLADATSNVRLVAKILAGVVVVGIVGFLAYRGVVYYIESRRPPAPPEQEYGELPEITFPGSVPASNYTYEVNTLDGNLPNLPDRLPVYRIQEGEQDLLALQNTRQRLENVGFSLNETRLDRNVYQWTRESGEIIKYDIISRNFEIFSAYLFNPPSGTFVSGEEGELIREIFDFLPQLGISTEQLQGVDGTKLHYFVIQNDRLLPTESIGGSQIIRVDLFQNPLATQTFTLDGETVESLPIVYPRPEYSTLNFLLEPSRGTGRIVEAHFTLHAVDQGDSSDYPILSSSEAWEQLNNGNAYLAQYDPNAPEVDITEVQLGYFLDDMNSGYAMPVIRFIGENFEAYVDAVDRTPPTSEPTE